MKVELLVRWPDDETPEALEERKLAKIINGEDEEAPVKYVYDFLTIDFKDIKTFNRLDETHTVVRTYDREAYAAKIPYRVFKKIYSRVTGQSIVTLTEQSEEI